MKKFRKIIFLALILIAMVFVCPHATTNVYAEEEIDKNYVVDSDDVSERLYARLCDIKKVETGTNVQTLYQKDFIEYVDLDLTIDNNISSLDGLHLFRFDKLQTLNISGNKLTNVTKTHLSSMPNLTAINLAGNNLGSVDLTELSKLTTIDLRSNKLSTIDFSAITGDVDINISNNLFDSIEDITLPNSSNSVVLNFISNNITDIPSSYLTSEKLTLKGGIQGVKDDDMVTLNKSKNLTCYNTNIEGLEVRIFKSSGELVKTITDIEGGKIDIALDVGKYEYKYYLDGELAYDEEDLNDKNSYVKRVFEGYEFIILPDAPTYTFEHKGKTYEKIGKVTGSVTINLTKSSENDVIYYKISGGEWQKGDKVFCDQGGNYNVYVKSICTIDGKEYESKTIEIFVKTSLNTVVPDGLMLVIVLLITLTLFFVVVPIVSKKFFKKK